MLIDTHAHLDYEDFRNDLEDVLRRAREAGVNRIITIGTSIESSRRAVEMAEKYPDVFAVIGVHPNEAFEAGDDVMTPLRLLAQSPRVVAIGETGLDYHRLPGKVLKETRSRSPSADPADNAGEIPGAIRDGAVKSAQSAIFEQQLDLAVELGLNVVIHQRDAWDDTLAILQPYTGKLRAVFHCFGGSIEQARQVFALNHIVSFTGIVTFKNAPLVHACAAQAADDQFMVETDCPYLAPEPFRGKRCEPAHTRLTAARIADLRGVSLEQIAGATTRTAGAFFRFERT